MNEINPMLTMPITESTLASTSAGSLRLNSDTATVQVPRINAHNNSEPSCAPQTAETL